MGRLKRERGSLSIMDAARFCFVAVGAAVAGAAVSTVGGAILADDSGSGASATASDATATQAAIAKDQWNRYKTVYAPLEDSMVSAAQNYDTPAQYERAAGEASGAVSQAFSNARDRLTRTPGMDTSSNAYTAGLADLDRQQAASDAVAQNTARKNVQDTAWARKSDMLSLGKGLPAQASTGLAAVAGQSANQANAAYTRGANEAAGLGALGSDITRGLTSAWNGANSPGLGSGQTFSNVGTGSTFSTGGSTAFGTAPTNGGYSNGGIPTVSTPNYGFGL
ncbi:hypothetical protein [Cupriavidus numazuensis]|uniref:Uncharacterized protein n=1 Tax=Cupriavidus numazuensis TaxID=221992 RepID=A0ABN7PWW2_9BURK|nr:hypothetical protein [Cupriavidus numazuensis]CAG2132566.1 hypothetical protein LMG26411_00639 [Cupriavidus numazuensis]